MNQKILKEKLERHKERIKKTEIYFHAYEKVIKDQRKQIQQLKNNLPYMIYTYLQKMLLRVVKKISSDF